ncbi:hypothetical protein CANARDRAFT_62637 [[Candida] arabinofermentans NRRL YB-2248]|uniref:Uncharacterized protein n=1 Tax=[Candida] arabinofermentans NRRL YB-2248 TaxID=983967 RepID=A0A1E4SXX9_9ASCO|nr:hypothetical protein CANARDRAFT_62637 [[Candida] arabinofermentans NRRL YB-2248]
MPSTIAENTPIEDFHFENCYTNNPQQKSFVLLEEDNNNTEASIELQHYFLSPSDSWAHCPYQRYFAERINEPLPTFWRESLENKNNRFSNDYQPLLASSSRKNDNASNQQENRILENNIIDSPESLDSLSTILECLTSTATSSTSTTTSDLYAAPEHHLFDDPLDSDFDSPIVLQKPIPVKHLLTNIHIPSTNPSNGEIYSYYPSLTKTKQTSRARIGSFGTTDQSKIGTKRNW